MREGAVRLRHPVRVFLLLYRLAFALRRQDQLGGQALGHRLLFARAAVLDDPTHPQRRAPLGAYFDGHLIRRTADATRLHFQRRLHVRQRLLEHVHAGLPRALLDRSEEHTSELQSQSNLVCRLLHEKKKTNNQQCRPYRILTFAHSDYLEQNRYLGAVITPSRLPTARHTQRSPTILLARIISNCTSL